MFLNTFIIFVFAVAMFTAAYRDATTMKIPNWASLLVLAGFFLVVPFIWSSWAEIGSAWHIFGEHILVGLTVFAVGLTVFAFGWLGGGDSKLMAATAFWWQWPDLLIYMFYTTMAGAIFAIILMVGRRYIPDRVLTTPLLSTLFKDGKNMPYGLALAFGALATLPQSTIFKAALGLG